ncbi:MAG: FkbM family methyltransferase [Pirellulales bacterium]
MTAERFVSYAQNFEDVMLWRALRHVRSGFYVDVGADDPTELSVTKAFSDRGWRGINVEPVAKQHAKFIAQRPRDVNLRLLAGSVDEPRPFFQVGEGVTGLSSMIEGIATRSAAVAGAPVRVQMIPARSLDSILDEHRPAAVHFLKIDVEGGEADVLRGLSLDRHRPWIIVVESATACSRIETHGAWEPMLLAGGYRAVYADGLNRFYVAEEHAHLQAAFGHPPNVFDDFVLAGGAFQCGGVDERIAAALAALPRPPAPLLPPTSPAPRQRSFPHIAAGYVDADRKTALSVRWVARHPRAACGLLARQPGKVLRFAARQPRKFLIGMPKDTAGIASGGFDEATRTLADFRRELAELAGKLSAAWVTGFEHRLRRAEELVLSANRAASWRQRLRFADLAAALRGIRRDLDVALRPGRSAAGVRLPDSPTVSVVISTFNRCGPLRDALTSLRGVRFAGSFEVIVVNGPSTDGTDALLQEWSADVRLAQCPLANISVSRNIGIRMARGDIVAFLDDDAVAEPEWLDRLVAAYRDPEVGGVGGHVIDHAGRELQWGTLAMDRLGSGVADAMGHAERACFPGAFRGPHLPGANASFRRDVLLSIGGFDEEYEYFHDETDVCLRVMDAGYRLVSQPGARVHHRYAASHLRTERRVWRNTYPVLKNQLYFTVKHGHAHVGEHVILATWRRFVDEVRAGVQASIEAGHLPASARDAFEGDVRRALADGKARGHDATGGSIDAADLRLDGPGFQPFSTRSSGDARSIVLVSHDYPPAQEGGIATYNRDLATALCREGHTVHVVCATSDVERTDFEAGVWVHRIAAADAPLSPQARAVGVPQPYWNWSLAALREVERISQQRPIDAVETPIWSCQAVAFLLDGRFPVVVGLQTTMAIWMENHPEAVGDAGWMETIGRPTLALERWILRGAHAVRSISRAIMVDIEERYAMTFDRSRVVIAPLGLVDAASPPAAHRRNGGDEVLFVGRLEHRKGIDILLDAVPAVLESCPDVRFRIVGDDSIPSVDGVNTYRQLFEDRWGGSGPARAVSFEGRLPDDAVRRAYASCDIFVSPSRYESFGLVFLEAMRAGRPVIGCDVGGMPEVIEQGRTGMLVRPADATALAEAIVELVRSRDLRERLGCAGRNLFVERFSAERMAVVSRHIYDLARSVHDRAARPRSVLTFWRPGPQRRAG